jgi:hypothetical protein
VQDAQCNAKKELAIEVVAVIDEQRNRHAVRCMAFDDSAEPLQKLRPLKEPDR